MTQIYQRSRIKMGILIATAILGNSHVARAGFMDSMKSMCSSPELRKTVGYLAAPLAIYTTGKFLLSSGIADKSSAIKKALTNYGESFLCGLTLFCVGKIAHQYKYVSNETLPEGLFLTGLLLGSTLSLRSTPTERSIGSSIQKLDTTMGDYIGTVPNEIDELIRYLQDDNIRLKYKAYQVTPPRGILLHGPSGTGKTHLISCLAGTVQIPFIKTSKQELTQGLIGATEDSLRNIFTVAQNAAKNSPKKLAFLFIDEIDAMVPVRSNSDTTLARHDNSVTSLFLELLDGIIKDDNGQVIVVGCTNRKEAIDGALIRPGRLEKHIYVPLPNLATCKKILRHYIIKYGKCTPSIALIDGFANNLHGKSPATIAEAVKSAVRTLIDTGRPIHTQTILQTILSKNIKNKPVVNNNARRKSF